MDPLVLSVAPVNPKVPGTHTEPRSTPEMCGQMPAYFWASARVAQQPPPNPEAPPECADRCPHIFGPQLGLRWGSLWVYCVFLFHILHLSVNSFRFLSFSLWLVLGPGGLREAPGWPRDGPRVCFRLPRLTPRFPEHTHRTPKHPRNVRTDARIFLGLSSGCPTISAEPRSTPEMCGQMPAYFWASGA